MIVLGGYTLEKRDDGYALIRGNDGAYVAHLPGSMDREEAVRLANAFLLERLVEPEGVTHG